MKKRTLYTILALLIFNGKGFSQINEVNAPVENFEELWKEFDDRYANFELKEVNWKEIYDKYKSLVNENTINKELFEICCSMLQELNDGHVTINPNFKEDDIECGPPYEFTLDVEFNTDKLKSQLESIIDVELTKNGFSDPVKKKLSEETNFQFRVSDSFGYLRLDEMTEKITFGGFKRAIDQAIKALQSKKGLIIDLRFNGGGWDHNAYKLASRFVPEGKTVGHFERVKIKGTNEFTPMQYKTVKSGGKNQFTEPIVILTSDFTASAAEVFLLVMRELPNVSIVGDYTEGIFSDMHEFKLSNKWTVSLSHQQYFSQKKENFEGKGIAPNIFVVNKRIDLDDKRDPVIKKAIHYLKSENKR